MGKHPQLSRTKNFDDTDIFNFVSYFGCSPLGASNATEFVACSTNMAGPFDTSERSQQLWLRRQYIIIFTPVLLELSHLGKWISESVPWYLAGNFTTITAILIKTQDNSIFCYHLHIYIHIYSTYIHIYTYIYSIYIHIYTYI